MKKYLPLIFIALLASCSSEEPFLEEVQNYEKRISVVASDLVPDEGTRTAYTENGNSYSFKWIEGDEIGIFPENGRQTSFPISDGHDTNTALFNGGDWALKPNASYAAYYPLNKDLDTKKNSIPVSYLGQTQNGNGDTRHIAQYDYMASEFTQVDAKGNVNLILKHLGSLVQFKLKMPNADTFSKVVISSDNAEFITEGTVDLAENQASINPTATASSFTINLSGISTTSDNESLIVNTMIAPVDFSSSLLTVKVYGLASIYTTTLLGKNLANGSAYVNDSELEKSNILNCITFEADDVQTLTMTKAVETLEYSLDNGMSWSELGTIKITFGGDNGRLRLRGKNLNGTSASTEDYSQILFGYGTEVKCSGDIRTLLDYENYTEVQTNNARFSHLFENCRQLISTPELPATTLADGCYERMFAGCTSLTAAPDLPATTIAANCYSCMFLGASIKEIPEYIKNVDLVKSWIASEISLQGLFAGLPITDEYLSSVLPVNANGRYYLDKGYSEMFRECKLLKTAPELPAINVGIYQYSSMFEGCTSLTTAPSILPATNLKYAYACYKDMFNGCTSLNVAPELPATILSILCYQGMFAGCTNLSYIKMMATDISEWDCLCYWTLDVAENGTFVKNADATWNSYGVHGIPEGWTVKYVDENGNEVSKVSGTGSGFVGDSDWNN